MTGSEARRPDAARSKLRDLVAAVDREMSRLPKPQGGAEDAAMGGLRVAWSALVDLMALGPEPEYRTCPTCGNIGMRTATVCGYCWSKLPALGPLAS
jgi:hypothetical protein